ncbi:MAG: hypothetical protein KZQ91_08965 [Candidatus Thiodiazotropha sp. (ex Lucinoma borealis)]|nr:hypothetical protein [Candidatus Thiodiazotropha sp. (ex Lucinoma borealis)]
MQYAVATVVATYVFIDIVWLGWMMITDCMYLVSRKLNMQIRSHSHSIPEDRNNKPCGE